MSLENPRRLQGTRWAQQAGRAQGSPPPRRGIVAYATLRLDSTCIGQSLCGQQSAITVRAPVRSRQPPNLKPHKPLHSKLQPSAGTLRYNCGHKAINLRLRVTPRQFAANGCFGRGEFVSIGRLQIPERSAPRVNPVQRTLRPGSNRFRRSMERSAGKRSPSTYICSFINAGKTIKRK